MASIRRASSTLLTRKRSAMTSIQVCSPSTRWLMNLVKPLLDSHCAISASLTWEGKATPKVSATRASPVLAFRSAAMLAGVSACTGKAVAASNSLAARANKSLKWSFSSVIVPTVERLLRTGLVWSMAMAGGTPSTASTAGRSMRSKNWRA